MIQRRKHRQGAAWLELLLALAIFSLILQLFPPLAQALDVRTWTRSTWFVVNLVFVTALVLIRLAPDWVLDWRSHRDQKAADKKIQERQLAAKERREAKERMRQAMKRRLY